MRMLGPGLFVEMLESEVRKKFEHEVRVNIYGPLIDERKRNWILVIQDGTSVAQVELPILENFTLDLDGFMQRVLTPAIEHCKNLLSDLKQGAINGERDS